MFWLILLFTALWKSADCRKNTNSLSVSKPRKRLLNLKVSRNPDARCRKQQYPSQVCHFLIVFVRVIWLLNVCDDRIWIWHFSKCCYFHPCYHLEVTTSIWQFINLTLWLKLPIKTLLALFSKEFNSFAVNDLDSTRATTPAVLNNMTAKMDLIRRQGLNLSTAFGFINVNDLNRKIYRFEKVHFSNCSGLLGAYPGENP